MNSGRRLGTVLGVILAAILAGCQSSNTDYVIVKYTRRPTIVFKAYSDSDTDAYQIKHGNLLIEAECAHESHPSWDSKTPPDYHCLLPVGQPMQFKMYAGFSGHAGLSYSADGKTTDLLVTSEGVSQ